MERGARLRFLDHYRAIREAEGRGSNDPAYYRALPFHDLTGRNSGQWEIRARSFRHLERILLPELETPEGRLRILDLGAGTGWLSWRLGLRGHFTTALDIFTDERDGLAAVHHFPSPPPAIAAEFDALPFADSSFDLAIFNSSLHYSADYTRTLAEALRVLQPSGTILIVDSPVYEKAEHGQRMRAERQAYFERTYGFRSEAQGSVEYLDEPTLESLARQFGLEWRRSYPWYGWRWAMRPWKAMLRGQRPPSRFFILAGRRTGR